MQEKINTPHGRVLAAVGAYDAFHALSKKLRTELYLMKLPNSVDVIAGDSLNESGASGVVLSSILSMIDGLAFKCPWMDGEMLIHDYFRTARGLAYGIKRVSLEGLRDRDKECLSILHEKAETILSNDTLNEARLVFITNALFNCYGFSRMDDATYWIVEDDSVKGVHSVLKLECKKPEPLDITVNNEPRRAYRVRGAWMNELFEASLAPSSLPRCTGSARYPVFIQAHAIRRFEERLDCLTGLLMQTVSADEKNDPKFETGIRMGIRAHIRQSLCDSFKNPRILDFEGGLMAEYRLNGNKVGYFPCLVAEGKILLPTFLLMTMDGTPEGKNLQDRLRLRRPDKEYLKLDCLETFLLSDIKDDSELVEILDECGCGSLFKIARSHVDSIYRSADVFRKYLLK